MVMIRVVTEAMEAAAQGFMPITVAPVVVAIPVAAVVETMAQVAAIMAPAAVADPTTQEPINPILPVSRQATGR